jgi:predicted RNase H-like nuclease
MSALKNFYHDDLERKRAAEDDMDIDVCTNCGAYFEWLPRQRNQRCGPCRAGLNDPAREQVSA